MRDGSLVVRDSDHPEWELELSPPELDQVRGLLIPTDAQPPRKRTSGILTLDVEGWTLSVRVLDGGYEVSLTEDGKCPATHYVRLDHEQSDTLHDFLMETTAAQPPAAPVEVPPDVIERRRKGLSDYEKPPLGQPPSWLQAQEKIEAAHSGCSAATGDARGLALNANAMAKLEKKKGNAKTAGFLRGIATYLNTLNEPQVVRK
jgi:hypothetical protein